VDIIIRNAQNKEIVVNQLGRGAYFGEMALMGDKRRMATVRVSQGASARVIEMTAQEFEDLTRSSEQFKDHVQSSADVRKEQLESESKRKVGK